MANKTQVAPLAGVKVLDLSRLLPGPMASLHLADLGADVIKVEDPLRGDYGRWMGPLKKNHSGWFLAVNRNKRSISLNLKSDLGRQALLDLAAAADVLIESFRPGVMDRLDLGFDVLHQLHPRLVVCSISGYGQSGPLREKAGHDINYCALTGLLEQNGSRGAPPALGNFQIADLAGGALSAVAGILAALYSVARGSPGRHVDIAMADCAAAHGVMALMELQAYGKTAQRGDGFLTGQLPGYAVYQTLDNGYMAAGALEPQFWSELCLALELPELIDIDQQDTQQCRNAQAQLAEVFALQTRAHWTQLFSELDCCVGPVLSMAEAMAEPQLVSRGLYFTAEHPLEGEVTQFACPIKMTDFQFTLARHAPDLGEHSAEILQDIGYSQQQIESLISAQSGQSA